MPRVKKRAKLRHRGWTDGDRELLLTGNTFSKCSFGRLNNINVPFEDDLARAAWKDLRDELMQEHLAHADEEAYEAGEPPESVPGIRPWAWWRYDAPEPRKVFDPTRAFCQSHPKVSPGKTERLSFGVPSGFFGSPNQWGPRVESQVCYLFRHGLLTDDEIAALDDEQPLLDCWHDDQENWSFLPSEPPVEAVVEKLEELERETAELQAKIPAWPNLDGCHHPEKYLT